MIGLPEAFAAPDASLRLRQIARGGRRGDRSSLDGCRCAQPYERRVLPVVAGLLFYICDLRHICRKSLFGLHAAYL